MDIFAFCIFLGATASPNLWGKMVRARIGNHWLSKEQATASRARVFADTVGQGDQTLLFRFSNITSIQSKVASVVEAAEQGYHMVVETKADTGTKMGVTSEVAALAKRLPCRILWGEEVLAKSAGVAMVEGARTKDASERLRPPTEKQKKVAGKRPARLTSGTRTTKVLR